MYTERCTRKTPCRRSQQTFAFGSKALERSFRPPRREQRPRECSPNARAVKIVRKIRHSVVGTLSDRITLCTDLREYAEHFQRRRDAERRRNGHVAKVHGERFAPYAEMADVEHGQIARQRQHDGFAVVPTQRHFFSVFVRHPDALRGRFVAGAYPELGI